MRISFSQEVIDYVVRHKIDPKRARIYNRLSKSLHAFKWCDNCLHYHSDLTLFDKEWIKINYQGKEIEGWTCTEVFYTNRRKDECYYCDCKVFKPIPFKLEIYTEPEKVEFKYIHKTKSSLYWKLIEIETKQARVIEDYVYHNKPKDKIQDLYL